MSGPLAGVRVTNLTVNVLGPITTWTSIPTSHVARTLTDRREKGYVPQRRPLYGEGHPSAAIGRNQTRATNRALTFREDGDFPATVRYFVTSGSKQVLSARRSRESTVFTEEDSMALRAQVHRAPREATHCLSP